MTESKEHSNIELNDLPWKSDAHKWRLTTDSKHGAEQTINRQS